MEETYSSDDETNSVEYMDVVTSSMNGPPLRPPPRKSKTPAERQREYRLRLKQRILNNVEEKRKTLKKKIEYQRQYRFAKKMKKAQMYNGDNPAKKTRADYQREYRLRKKLRAELNSGSTGRIPMQEAGPSVFFNVGKVQSRDEHSQGAVQDCECQSTIKMERTEPHPVFQIQTVPFVEIVPKSEKQITQEIEESCVTPDADDKYDVLGKYVASKVRQLDIQQRMYAERIIHEAIYEGQMGHLNINSQLVVNTETFVTSQSHYNKTMRSEVAEIKEEREDELETQETEPDLEQKSTIKDGNESCSSFAGCGVKRRRSKTLEETPEHLTNVANIKLEIETEENEYLPGNLGTQYYVPITRNSTVHESHYPDDAIRKKNNRTHPEHHGIKLKTEIDLEESWNPQETNLDNVSKFATEIELGKIKRETGDGLG